MRATSATSRSSIATRWLPRCVWGGWRGPTHFCVWGMGAGMMVRWTFRGLFACLQPEHSASRTLLLPLKLSCPVPSPPPSGGSPTPADRAAPVGERGPEKDRCGRHPPATRQRGQDRSGCGSGRCGEVAATGADAGRYERARDGECEVEGPDGERAGRCGSVGRVEI